jgi:hypothetical protein
MEPTYEISPEPTEDERAAIVEALAAEDTERPQGSPWGDGLLPARDRD